MKVNVADTVFAIYHPANDKYWDGVTFVPELGSARLYDLREGAEVPVGIKDRLQGAVVVRVKLDVHTQDERKMRTARKRAEAKQAVLAEAAAGGEL